MVISDQGPLDLDTRIQISPDGNVEREQALDDPGPQAGGDKAPVASDAELVFSAFR